MRTRRSLILLAAAAVVAALVIGILQSSGGDDGATGDVPSAAARNAALAGAPAPLAAVHRDANALLDAGQFTARVKALHGYPIVVNVWGSWCVPCRAEFPVFERVSVKLGKRVAFLGVATQDAEEAAGKFLKAHPVAFPSFLDFDGKIARQDIGSIGTPSTLFIDAKGKRAFLHQGPYYKDAELERDIERYAGA
ncbi:MAG: TlpA family protein disulfide reductase [Solirubrobacteraceae bacterium]